VEDTAEAAREILTLGIAAKSETRSAPGIA
jgi:hypothetical protein